MRSITKGSWPLLLRLPTSLLLLLLSHRANAREITDWSGWEKLVAGTPPNATGTADFSTYDLSRPYRSNATRSAEWNVTVEVYSDIPWYDRYRGDEDEEEEAEDAGVDETMFGTGTLIRLAAPRDPSSSSRDGGGVELDDSWFSCVSIWNIPLSEQVVGSEDEVNGAGADCERVMKSGCWEWVRKVNEGGDLCEQNKALDMPESCQGASFYSYVTRVPEAGYVLADFLHDGGTTTTRETHQKGNHTAYDRTLRGIWIGMFGFAQSAGDDEDDGSSDNSGDGDGDGGLGLQFYPKNDTGLEGGVVCLRASDVAEGSRGVEEGEEDVQRYLDEKRAGDEDGAAAAGLHVSAWTVLGAAAMAAGLLLV